MKNNKIRRRIGKKTFSMPNPKKYLVIPLSFGKGLKLSVVEVKRKFLAKPWQYAAMSMISILLVSSSMFVYKNYFAKGATYGWLQTDWSGGVATTTATHTNNQENWTYYSSKTDNLSTTGGVLTQTSASPTTWTETADADFSDNGTYTNTYNSSGSVRSKKPNGLACTTSAASTECLSGYCKNSVCTSQWVTIPVIGGEAYFKQLGSYSWKTTATDCLYPQCSLSGTYPDTIVADNNVNFSLYPARAACQAIGGRLPTTSEIIYIGSYLRDVIISFSRYSNYWSNSEVSASAASTYNAYEGSYTPNKTATNYVICVK